MKMREIKTYETHLLENSPQFDGENHMEIYDLDGNYKFHIKGYSLDSAEVYDADMSNCYFRQENLEGSIFSKCNLRGCNFEGAWMKYFCGAESDFSGSNMRGVDMSSSDFTETNMSGVDITKSNIHKTDFSNSNLSGIIGLHTCRYLNHANFAGCDFTGVDRQFFTHMIKTYSHGNEKLYKHRRIVVNGNYENRFDEVSILEFFEGCKGIPENIDSAIARAKKTRSIFNV